jgi:hypothetical protein
MESLPQQTLDGMVESPRRRCGAGLSCRGECKA